METPELSEVDSRRVIVGLPNDRSEDTVIWLAGEHDLSSVDELAQAIVTAAGAGRSDLIFDLRYVEFMDSTTIEQILAACTSLGEEGRMARVRDPSPAARYLLEICNPSHLVET
jgi:anti-anti-sigma factor